MRKNRKIDGGEDGWSDMIDGGDWRGGCIERGEMMGSWREGRWQNWTWSRHVCVPVGPMCLRGLVLAGGLQGRSMLVRMRVGVRVCVGGRVGRAGGALWGRVVGVGGWRAAVVQTVELIHFLICRLWTKTDTERQRETDSSVLLKCHILFFLIALFYDG